MNDFQSLSHKRTEFCFLSEFHFLAPTSIDIAQIQRQLSAVDFQLKTNQTKTIKRDLMEREIVSP